MNLKKIIILTAGLIALTGGAGQCQITKDEALSKFVTAGMAYKEGKYDAAINLYTEILEGSRVSGPLYYNLGNSYFKKGQVGKAALNYERAKKFIPRDSDLKFNELYIQSHIKYYGEEKESRGLAQEAFLRFTQFYTVDEMVVILLGLVLGMGILLLLAMYFGWPFQWDRRIFTSLLLAFAVFTAGLFGKITLEKGTSVIMDDTESYFEPRSDSTVHYKLSEGMTVKVLKSEGAWSKVQRSDGKIGWIDSKDLEKI